MAIKIFKACCLKGQYIKKLKLRIVFLKSSLRCYNKSFDKRAIINNKLKNPYLISK